MAKNNKNKLLEIYAKASTPQELFLDTIKYVKDLDNKFSKVQSTLDDTIQFAMENKPKSNEELEEIIKPLIPKPINGKNPSKEELISLISPLIPEPVKGEDGTDITPIEVRNKIKELKGIERLSIFDLKDTELLKGGKGMNWSSTGFKVYTDNTLTGDGSFANPLHALGGGSSITLKTNGTNNGSQSILNLKAGSNITLTDDGVGGITFDASGGSYTLPIASASTLGGIKVGSGLSIDAGTGVLSATGGGSGTVTSVAALTLGTSGTDLSSSVANSTTTPVITLNVPTASATNRGVLSSTDWSTFNNKQTALTIGNLTDAGTDGITITGGTGAIIGSGTSIAQHVADSTHNGYLSSTDWSTFNNKGVGTVTSVTSATGDATIATTTTTPVITIVSAPKLTTARTIGTLTGDATTAGSSFDGTANNTNALTLATVNSNVGSFGSATQSLTATVNAKGLVTAISAQTVTPAVGSITGLGTGVATALAVNVGSAGAFVTFNGALGTPSSGTLTNCTGLPTASVLAGTFGTGAFTMDTRLTVPQVINTANAITASGNAATVPVTSKHNIVTNNSAATLTVTLTTSGAVNMQTVIVQILDFSVVAQTITWVNTENSTVTAPVTSNGSTTLPLTVGFIYNSATSKWRCIASA